MILFTCYLIIERMILLFAADMRQRASKMAAEGRGAAGRLAAPTTRRVDQAARRVPARLVRLVTAWLATDAWPARLAS